MKKLLITLLMTYMSLTQAATVNLSWDDDLNDPAIVGGYSVHVGTLSGDYTDTFDAGPAKSLTVYPLLHNTLYYFAATAYPADPNNYKESGFSNEVSVMTPIEPLTVDFSASVVKGRVPLVINFTSSPSRPIVKCKWSFGDGTGSTACNPAHKYGRRGTYSVKLVVTDSTNVSATKLKSNYIQVTR